MIYLDNAGTTKVSEKAKQAMLPFFDEFMAMPAVCMKQGKLQKNI